ncbi:MAG: hypothetical protein NUV51_01315 [Sulfuricaulis sp.]|nr:hypothetical protein [Sulfuricaulis sp.]
MSKATDDVLAERQRQMEAEGWTPEHDDEHDPGDLAAAGASYALNAADQLNPYSQGDAKNAMPMCWPDWSIEWWKPKNPRRDLVRAAALLIAEIERLDRAALKTPNVLADRLEPIGEASSPKGDGRAAG